MDYETQASDRPERFLRGSLEWSEGGVILNEQHNRQAPIMRFAPEEREGRVLIDASLPDTQRSRDAATMAREGTFTGLSVEFWAARASSRAGAVRSRRPSSWLRRSWTPPATRPPASSSGNGQRGGGYGCDAGRYAAGGSNFGPEGSPVPP